MAAMAWGRISFCIHGEDCFGDVARGGRPKTVDPTADQKADQKEYS